LDLGTGRGWPGQKPWARASVVVAAASGITFHPGSFDAIIHTDVLC
jgi:hypothetical protein